MARFLGILGDLSGKLGGSVFSRNKAGAYARSWVKPTNANSEAQVRARASFATSISAWHALTDLEKAQWNDFAATRFKPKETTAGVAYSGVNAFTSLRNFVNNSNALLRDATLSSGGSFTAGTFNLVNTPPSGVFSGNLTVIKSGNPVVCPIVLTGGEFRYDGSFMAQFTLAVPITAGTTGDTVSFTDPSSGEEFGISAYISSSLVQGNQAVNNKFLQSLGAVAPIGAITGLTGAQTTISINVTNSLPFLGNAKLWPNVGDYTKLSVFAISATGRTMPLGMIAVPVTEP